MVLKEAIDPDQVRISLETAGAAEEGRPIV